MYAAGSGVKPEKQSAALKYAKTAPRSWRKKMSSMAMTDLVSQIPEPMLATILKARSCGYVFATEQSAMLSISNQFSDKGTYDTVQIVKTSNQAGRRPNLSVNGTHTKLIMPYMRIA
jgi:hypothetical protein